MSTKWWTENSYIYKRNGKILCAGMICTALLFASGCSLLPKEENEEVLPPINPPKLSKKPEYTVKSDTLETKVRGIGKLMATKEEELFFTDDNKRVKDVYVKSGDQVEAGQLIAEIDVSDLESQLRQKRLQNRKDELAMKTSLRNASAKDADELEQSRIDFELKQDDMLKLEESIGKAKITAPFAGTVVSVYNKKGDTVKAYDSVAVVADLSQVTVVATINAEDLKKVAVGMETVVDINAAGQFKGKVIQLPNPKATNTNNNGNYGFNQGGSNQEKPKDTIDNYVVVELNLMPGGLTRGTPLSISVITQKKEKATIIPLAALRSITGRNYVQVVDDNGNKREVDVEIGQQTPTDVEIVKGLTPGQKVVGR